MGGRADFKASVVINVKSFIDFWKSHPNGQNINFSIREFVIAAIQNDILFHGGPRTDVGAFLLFAYHMKASIRIQQLKNLL